MAPRFKPLKLTGIYTLLKKNITFKDLFVANLNIFQNERAAKLKMR